MRLLLPAMIGLAFVSQSCRRPEEPTPAGDTVAVELLSRTLSRRGLVQEYQITNSSSGPIYFVCPEPACGNPHELFAPPFYELSEGSTLWVYSYFARLPRRNLPDQTEYTYALRRVDPGVFRGKIEILAPLQSNPPYPSPTYRRSPIDGFWVDRIRLTFGVLPCAEADLRPSPDQEAPPGIIADFHETRQIHCGPARGPARDFQKLIGAEASIAWTGCWPDAPHAPGTPTWCEEEDDAGR